MLTIEQLAEKGGEAFTEFLQSLHEEDVQLLSKIPSGLLAKVFQAGALFAIETAIEEEEIMAKAK